ncbi:MAG: 2-amino-4-hydroxy-6-hydroxymethyldihydropteridine diphosphokinase [Flavobacteriales bacterium]|nr:2-amino-4-hydroxy-6-hydroxymethyldihydropteridine diphosphokinase [Flavobacteriales bacterium]
MARTYEALLLLGGNLGSPKENLGRAESMIAASAGRIIARSRDHWTRPWGFVDDRLFLNRAVLLESVMEPLELLGELLSIEIALGRHRNTEQRYEARTLDIDILLVGDRVIDHPALQVPHPRMHERFFALEPTADIAPDQVHPILHRTVLQLLNDLRHPE